jgi:hypothetical protein
MKALPVKGFGEILVLLLYGNGQFVVRIRVSIACFLIIFSWRINSSLKEIDHFSGGTNHSQGELVHFSDKMGYSSGETVNSSGEPWYFARKSGHSYPGIFQLSCEMIISQEK